MLTVIQNAYLKKALKHNDFCEIHQNILFVLIHEKKYYTKEELLCLANYNYSLLEKALKDLEELKIIIVDGWLVRLKDFQEFNKEICEELIEM
jgi:predicted transcriptional regulator